MIMRPTPMHMSDETINQLVDRGFLAPKEPTTEHPLVKWLHDKFEAGSDILTKPKAYEIARVIEEQAARINELETAGGPTGRESPDVGCAALPADVGRLACDLECEHSFDPCEERSTAGLFCTLPDGHEGQHVACSEERHAIASWNDAPQPRDDTDERVDDALDAGEWPNEGGR